jgi:hypothetical protein
MTSSANRSARSASTHESPIQLALDERPLDTCTPSPATDHHSVPPSKAFRNRRAAIDDAGAKIEGARKDLWATRGLMLEDLRAMSGTEAASLLTKLNVWRPDYASMIARGADPLAAALTKILYDKLITRPKENTAPGRERYVTMMRAVREVLSAAKSIQDLEKAEERISEVIGYRREDWRLRTPDNDAARACFYSVFPHRRSTLYVDGAARAAARKLLDRGFPSIEPWQRRYSVIFDRYPARSESAAQRLMAEASELGTPLTSEQLIEGIYRICTRAKPQKTVGYAATKEAADQVASRTYEKQRSPAAQGLKPVRPHLDEIFRTGLPDRRTRPAESQDFIDIFGFRGLQFGNWAADDERHRLLDHAFDALHDLADVLGVAPQVLSLDGSLGLALGARGSGGAAAHYEPSRLVTNLTKLRGSGCLAHEMGHALDYYFGELDRLDAHQTLPRAVTGGHTRTADLRNSHLREPVRQAWKRVMQVIYERPRTYAEAVADAKRRVQERTESLASAERYVRTITDANAGNLAAHDRRLWSELLDRRTQALRRAEAELNTLQTSEPKPGTYGNVPTTYYNEALILCGKSAEKGYWARPTELWARAFEAYVFDRLATCNARSDYLVQGVEPDRFRRPLYQANPYPAGEDRTRINSAIQELIEALCIRTGSSGFPTFF